MRKAWLGLGGNVGDVKAALCAALQGLDAQDAVTVTAVSPLYRTPPWGPVAQDWFHNCCAEIETELVPRDLLAACQLTERQGKRVRDIRWGPRTIDVDIIAVEGVDMNEDGLTIPHPRACERAFVMVPLADIAPNTEIAGQTAAQWAAALADSDVERLDLPADWWRAEAG